MHMASQCRLANKRPRRIAMFRTRCRDAPPIGSGDDNRPVQDHCHQAGAK